MAITISDEDRHFIYSIVGYPTIEIEDTGVLTDDIVDSYVIEPSLKEYFRWFAIEEIVNTQVTSGNTSVTIDFPEDDDVNGIYTYSVKDCRLSQLQDTNIYNSSNTADFTNPIVQFRNIGFSSGGGRLGSRMDYGFNSIQGSTNFVNDAMTNMNQVFYNRTDELARTVTIYSQNPGIVQTTFAKYSTNVNHIKYTSKREFLDLCRGELLLYWANSLKRVTPDLPVSFNLDALVEDGNELKELTLNKWRNKTRAVMMRN